MKLIQYLRLRGKYLILVFLILALVLLGLFSGNYFTGKVVSENCTQVEICVNKTIQVCDESLFEEICEDECVNETLTECFDSVNVVCSEVCSEVENETICEEVCEEVTEEVCEDSEREICSEVCTYVENVSSENCTEEIVASCSFEVVCEDEVISEEVDETVSEKEVVSTPVEEVVSPEKELEGISFDEDLSSLSDAEKSVVKLRTGVSSVSKTKSEIINGKLIVRIEVGDYWVEKAYPYTSLSESQDEINRLIELDELRLMKNIASSEIEIYNEEMEVFLGVNEI